MSEFNIRTLVAEAEHELATRRSCDAQGTARIKPRRSEGELMARKQEAIVSVLRLVRDHEAAFRSLIQARRS